MITLVIAALAISTCIAFSDVVADKLMVAEGNQRGKTNILQAAQWTAFGLGGAIVQYAGGWLAEHFTLSFAFLSSAIAPFTALLLVLLLLQEQQVQRHSSLIRKEDILKIWTVIKSPQILSITGFLICLGLIPIPPLLFYVRDVLEFSESLIGTLGAMQFLGMGLGALAFGILFSKIGRYHPLTLSIGFNVISIVSLFLIRDRDSAIFIYFFSGFTNMIAVLGVLEFVAKVCPVGMEGTVYAAIISVDNLARSLGFVLGGWLYDSQIPFYLIVSMRAILTGLCWFLITPLRVENPRI